MKCASFAPVRAGARFTAYSIPAILLLALSPTALAQFKFAPINVPGSVATQARGINKSGEIVGFYKTAPCTDSSVEVPNCVIKGFKYVNGSYIKLMVPGSVATAILGVNDTGDLVGFYRKSDGSRHGFIWYHQNVVKTIDYPGTSLTTVPFGIDTAGTVVGGLWSVSANGTFASGGWVWVNGKFSNMSPAAPAGIAPCCWSVNGISNNGIISGQLFQSDFRQAWLKEGKDEDFYMNVPAGSSAQDTIGTGLNSATDIIGYGHEGWFAKHIELNEGSNDAKEVVPEFILVQYPNATQTYPFGLNDARAIAGTYVTNGTTHGFLAISNF